MKNMSRLAILVASALLGSTSLTLLADGATAAPQEPEMKNPYCTIKTVTRPKVEGWVRAIVSREGKRAIHVDKRILARKHLSRFLIAHECCHHELGHLGSLSTKEAAQNMPRSQHLGKRFELDADCCAARLLAAANDRPALQNAKQFMFRYGPKPTGFGYPSGLERSMVIRHCAKTTEASKEQIYLNEKQSSQNN